MAGKKKVTKKEVDEKVNEIIDNIGEQRIVQFINEEVGWTATDIRNKILEILKKINEIIEVL